MSDTKKSEQNNARKSRDKNQDIKVNVKSMGNEKSYVTIGRRVFISHFGNNNQDQDNEFQSQQVIMKQDADLKQKLEKYKTLYGNQYLFSNSYTSSDEESQSESSFSSADRNKNTSNDEMNHRKIKFQKRNFKKQHNKNKMM